MPYINTTATKTISKEQISALTREFGQAIELIPGKTEAWLMLAFNGEAKMAFRGKTDGDFCMVEVELFGKADRKPLNDLTAKICEIIEKILGISGDNVYVKYEAIDTWGYDGANL